MPYKCPKAAKAYAKQYREKYYRVNRESEKQRVRKRKREIKQRYQAYKKSVQCSRCGFDGKDSPWAIDFHHPDDGKSENDKEVAWLVKNGYSWTRIAAEIKKCIPVCANCHRTIHQEEHYASLAEQDEG